MRPTQEAVTGEFEKTLQLQRNNIDVIARDVMMLWFQSWYAILISQKEIKAAELQWRIDPPPDQRVLYDRAWTLWFTLTLNMGWASFSRDGVLKRLM